MLAFESAAFKFKIVFLFATLSWLASVSTAANTVDISKLKKGDKLEVQVGADWVPAEFVEAMSSAMIMVRCAGFPVPVGQLVSRTRLPANKRSKSVKPATGSGSATPDDPFATSDERAAGGRPRTWTDRDGKFSVEATLVRVDDGQVVLRRTDNKEIKVPLAKLSDEDQKFLSPPAADAESENKDSDGSEILALTPTDLNSARLLDLSKASGWHYKADPAPASETLKASRVPLKPVEFFTKPTRIMLLPSAKEAFVVYLNSAPGLKSPTSIVQACDLQRNKLVSAGVFGMGMTPLDLSPDGALVLAQEDGQGFGKHAELRIYTRESHKVKPLAAWFPYNHHASPFAKPKTADSPARPELGLDADVTHAAFVDAKHVISLSHSGELALWNVPKIEPVYVATNVLANNLAMSPGAKYFALLDAGAVTIVQTLDGQVVGTIPADNSGFFLQTLAFRDDGKRLALVQDGRRVRVWDLESRELLRDFALADSRGVQSTQLAWAGNEHLLLGGKLVVDVARRVAIWEYRRVTEAWQVHNGKLWFVGPGLSQTDQVLTGTAVPTKDAIKASEGLKEDELLVIHPGLEVAIELPAGPEADKNRQAIAKRLEENGMKVVPQSKIRLVGAIGAGKQQTITYRTLGRFRGPTSTHQVTPQILSLTFFVNDEPIWKHESQSGAPIHLRTEKNESIDQALVRSAQFDPSTFSKIWIPGYVARLPAAAMGHASDFPIGP